MTKAKRPPLAILDPLKLGLVLVLASACGGSDGSESPDAAPTADAADPDARPVPAEIADFLATIPGLTFTEDVTAFTGYRRFILSYVQPLDHDDPEGRSFEQRAILHHRERSAPFVLYTSGYYLFSDDNLSELSQAMASNQLDVEQRFFAPSTPNPTNAADYEQLRIAQAAADHHRFVTALKPYYNQKWLSTGHSKGGMTSIYHRRFYPDDVDATVAYVAPISFAAADTRYHAFFDTVADATCRQRLRDVQRLMLTQRAGLLTLLEAAVAGSGTTFNRFGGIEGALEDSIVGMPWSFFQGGSVANCAGIPVAPATDQQLFDYLINTAGIYTDGGIDFFGTYYYQAEVELGAPSQPTAHLDDLLQFQDTPIDFMPPGVTGTHSPAAMTDVDNWVKNEGSELLFIYGEFDPWYGGAFELGAGTTDSYKLIVAQANHGALIRHLTLADQDIALSAIESWMGVRPNLNARSAKPPELPHVNMRIRVR